MGMISRETIDKIFNAIRIEEVVGDFVHLKKRGANYVALSPFINEKTPSFYVNPVKGIFKCFSSGKGGTAVSFVMEHEKITYPEALRYLAKKYNIEIEETQDSAEEKEKASERETLFNVNQYAAKFFQNQLHNTDEGNAVALSYFSQVRGLTKQTIENFGLGYSPDNRRALIDAALLDGYTIENLVKAGFAIENERGNFDRFFKRVMFPVHNITGRVIAFGGRTLSSDKNIAKYVNSPETEIYHKSNVLYGLYQAKKSITAQNICYLVEGYLDVISFHQAGIENVVASSGTSLTEEQIKLIKRFTPNITILYDSDKAGIKAAFRGIDMILKEGMNVRVLLFPEGDDPDSFARKNSTQEINDFLAKNTKDFISFKTTILLEEAQNDPIKRADLIKEIVASIAIIPDAIARSVYIQQCSKDLEIAEEVLIAESNKILKKRFFEESKRATENPDYKPEIELLPFEGSEPKSVETIKQEDKYELEIIRLLIKYGTRKIHAISEDDDGFSKSIEVTVAEYIVTAFTNDTGLTLENPLYHSIYFDILKCIENDFIPGEKYFLESSNSKIQSLAIDLVAEREDISKIWAIRAEVTVLKEEDKLPLVVSNAISSLRLFKVDVYKTRAINKIKEIQNKEDVNDLMKEINMYNEMKLIYAKETGRVILR